MKTNTRSFGLLVDVITILLMFVAVYYFCWAVKGHPIFVYGTAIYYEAFILFSWSLALLIAAEYPIRRITSFQQEMFIVLRINGLAILILGTMTFVLKAHSLSRLFVIVYVLMTVIGMLVNRVLIRWTLWNLRKSGWDSRTRLIVGDGQLAKTYIAKMEQHKGAGIRVVGFVGEGNDSHDVGAPLMGDITNFRDILAQNPVDGVVVALSITNPLTQEVVRQCQLQGISVEILLDEFASILNASTLVYGTGVPRLLIPSIPHSPMALLWKRITDLAVSLVSLCISMPLLMLIVICIKLDDGGPIFFAQERIGLRGKRFRMYKFRSMGVDAEQRKQELMHMNEMSGPVFKVQNDPRVTRIGRFLRSTSLDELPQLWNVIIGDMSLVGPRPPLPSEVDHYDYAHRKRLSVKPGLTCLWQISGRNKVDFDQWMNLDMAYIDNWSYLSDWKILLKTIPAVLRRTGAS